MRKAATQELAEVLTIVSDIRRHAEVARELAKQQAAMLEARRRCRLLERLKERRWSEWKLAADRELEQAASESYLARWGRDEGGAAYNEMHDP